MKVLLVADEYFSWGIYGGFGAFTRKLGAELVKKGIEVEAIVHRVSSYQKPVGEVEVIDGVSVKTLPREKPAKFWLQELYQTDADIIHSQCGLFDTYLAFRNNPEIPKVITVQDLRTKEENQRLAQYEKTSGYPWYKQIWARYVKSCFIKAMKSADVVASQAKMLLPKIKEIYGVEASILLPNFIDVPLHDFRKSEDPTVLWLGRLDPIKCPELCFDLAKESPDVQFNILGASHPAYGGIERDTFFKKTYSDVKNLHFLGFQSGKVKENLLSKSWILINTSAYECIPVSFLEAMAHKCAILSTQNPDGITSRFGAWSKSEVEELKRNLDYLLPRCLGLGEHGYDYVKSAHSTEKGVKQHIELYEGLLK